MIATRIRVCFFISAMIGLPMMGNAAEKPNILFIVVDDLGYGDLSVVNMSEDVKTPHIDSLAESGVRFSAAYATSPICNASRVSIMSGCYQQRQGVYWYSGKGLYNPAMPTIAEVLKKEGYATGYVGKFHHGATDKPSGRGFPLNHGFDYFYGFSGGTKHYLHHKEEYTGKKDTLHQGPLYVGKEKKDIEGFTTELFGEQARDFINIHKDEPFYLHLSFNAVHNYTHQLPTDYLEKMGLKGFEDHDPDKESYWEWRQKIGYPNHPEGRAYYLGQLLYLDREIGRVLKKLDDLGLRENTAIYFVSDNGGSLVTYARNGIYKGGKYTLFEGGTRVPMIGNFPAKYQQAKVVDSPSSAMDLFPTICTLAGAEIPSGLDGVDVTALLTGDKETLNRGPLFWDTKHEHAVRDGKWKLLVTKKVPNSKLQIVDTPKGSFLFDLEKDPGETTNLYSKYPEVAESLGSKLGKWQTEVRNSAK